MTGAGPRPLRSHPAWTWSAIVGGSLLLAMVVAPLAYAAIQRLDPQTRLPFSRLFNRTAMVAAALALLALRREIGWQGLVETWRGEGGAERWRSGAAGFAAALLGVALVVAWALANAQIALVEGGFDLLALRTATTLVGAIAAALLEETFFRGLMLPGLARRTGWPLALVATSGLYSLVHLLVSDRSFVWTGYAPEVGFAYLARAIARQAESASIAPLAGLFLVGLVLGWLFRRTGSLSLVVGLHAGWATAFPLLRHATRSLEPIPGSSFLATHHYLVGRPWAWAAILFSGALAFRWASREAHRRAPRSARQSACG